MVAVGCDPLLKKKMSSLHSDSNSKTRERHHTGFAHKRFVRKVVLR
jgi:hypothetical protein